MIQLRQTIGVLMASVSITSFGVSGSVASPQPQTYTQTPKTEPSIQPSPQPQVQPPQREPDVIYVPTPQAVVDQMLALANVSKDDVLYDLGSGDGRIPITAAKNFGTRGVGIDINPTRIRQANQNARAAGVTDRLEFRQQDLFQADFSEATVVTLYLLPELNLKLRPELFRQLKPGTRIVSHEFDMGNWKPERVVQTPKGSTIYYWVVPKEIPANLQ